MFSQVYERGVKRFDRFSRYATTRRLGSVARKARGLVRRVSGARRFPEWLAECVWEDDGGRPARRSRVEA